MFLFLLCNKIPIPQDYDEDEETAMLEFSKLLSNRAFLIAFIQILDGDKTVPNKDRWVIVTRPETIVVTQSRGVGCCKY